MKVPFVLVVVAQCACALKSTGGVGVNFGPKNCVKLTKSSEGSCVITTDCDGADISQTEFAFDCILQNGKDVVRHSFGFGGFEANEEFDSEVKCGRCSMPSAVAGTAPQAKPEPAPAKKVEAILKPAPVLVVPPMPKAVQEAPMAHSIPKMHKKKEEVIPGAVTFKAEAASGAKAQMWPFSSSEKKPEVVKYGPKDCVSVYKSAEDHCIMSTNCDKDTITNYEFGLVCVDKTGSPVKHLFGKDSFDEKETFDTLIKCNKCLGLEDIPDTVALAGEVATMAKDVTNLQAVMKNISINVQMLNENVFKKSAGPSPAAAAPAPAAAAPNAEKALVHESTSHHRHHGHLRHRHHHRHHRRHYDDDDDEDEDHDDRDYDREEAHHEHKQVEAKPVEKKPVEVKPVPQVQLNEQPAPAVYDVAQAVQAEKADDSDGDDEDGSDED